MSFYDFVVRTDASGISGGGGSGSSSSSSENKKWVSLITLINPERPNGLFEMPAANDDRVCSLAFDSLRVCLEAVNDKKMWEEYDLLDTILYRNRNAHKSSKHLKKLEQVRRMLWRVERLRLKEELLAIITKEAKSKALTKCIPSRELANYLLLRIGANIVTMNRAAQYTLPAADAMRAQLEQTYFVPLSVVGIALLGTLRIHLKQAVKKLTQAYEQILSLRELLPAHLNAKGDVCVAAFDDANHWLVTAEWPQPLHQLLHSFTQCQESSAVVSEYDDDDDADVINDSNAIEDDEDPARSTSSDFEEENILESRNIVDDVAESRKSHNNVVNTPSNSNNTAAILTTTTTTMPTNVPKTAAPTESIFAALFGSRVAPDGKNTSRSSPNAADINNTSRSSLPPRSNAADIDNTSRPSLPPSSNAATIDIVQPSTTRKRDNSAVPKKESLAKRAMKGMISHGALLSKTPATLQIWRDCIFNRKKPTKKTAKRERA